jgi:integrative and conjugative element protein (TIGR02256 family)
MNQAAWVNKRLLDLMHAEADYWYPKETGGVLMGYWSAQEVVITDIIGPGPKAFHGRNSFNPDALWQEKEITSIYNDSGRIHTYLGDWHTHPNGSRRLSIKDLGVMVRTATYKPARAAQPIMGILHNNPAWKLAVWSFSFPRILSNDPLVDMDTRRYL